MGEAGNRHRMSAVVLADPAGRRPEASSRVPTRASSAAPSCNHGLTLLHVSTYREHFLWDTLGRLGGFIDENGAG